MKKQQQINKFDMLDEEDARLDRIDASGILFSASLFLAFPSVNRSDNDQSTLIDLFSFSSAANDNEDVE